MAGKQNEPKETNEKAVSGMKTETKPEQAVETREEKPEQFISWKILPRMRRSFSVSERRS